MDFGWASVLTSSIVIGEFLFRIALACRVIMRRRSYGVTMAWLILIVLVPLVGAAAYLFVGENRLGKRRVRRERELQKPYVTWLTRLRSRAASKLPGGADAKRIHDHALALTQSPAMPGNRLTLVEESGEVLHRIAADIDKARRSVHMAFYIWHDGGDAGLVAAAIERAARRGVECLILLDAVGSKAFLRSQSAQKMRQAGARIVPALPVGLLRSIVARIDLRNHRKIVVVDGEIAWTGSQNLVDPRFFKVDAGVGPWIDAMVRVEGPSVEAIHALFLMDWEIETDERCVADAAIGTPMHGEVGDSPVQFVPSGPGEYAGSFLKLLVAAVYAAQRELLLCTPYFVPDESLRAALIAAAQRGVEVTLIVPEKVDNLLVHLAARSHFDELLEAGVNVILFRGGLLHTKAVTVDHEFTLIGTSNLDMRSFWLNFENMLIVYDAHFTEQVRWLLHRYRRQGHQLHERTWRQRPWRGRFAENLAQVFSPVL